MFETLNRDRVALHPELAAGGRHLWECALRTANTPFLLTEIAYPDGDHEFWDVYFLNDSEALRTIIADPKIRLRQLDLVSRRGPGSRWSLFRVIRVWELHTELGNYFALELKSGKFFLPETNWVNQTVDSPECDQRFLIYAFE